MRKVMMLLSFLAKFLIRYIPLALLITLFTVSIIKINNKRYAFLKTNRYQTHGVALIAP